MHQCYHRFQSVFPAGTDHIPVVFRLCLVKLSLLRLNPGPFYGKTVGIKPCIRHQANILPVSVVVVHCLAAGFQKIGIYHPFPGPVITVDIVSFHLMGRRGRS